ncbi:hypothetical protein [Cyclobacterium jeungdonense]|uniref:Uncharacterized protein n=1 Tax=Cyclobacterium jeungdonense TaxID=708087 RepID=A0ABT8C9C4_9BACT|nr:hypothetical protein [Cyclobacterium jeungdonense]MDN3688971.1 hypothetical protein [Cyclobacterium jeungdonense]
MTTLEKEIVTIQKEKVPSLLFSQREVVTDPESKKIRLLELQKSQILGNISHAKVWIYFETADGGTYRINTTIWAVGEKFISLKGGITIPISSIFNID